MQKHWEKHEGDVKPRFLFTLGSPSKQVGDEGDLSADVSFAHPSDLSLTKHVHHLVSLERSLCRFNGKEVHPWFDQLFDKAMILLDQVIQVFDLPQFDRCRKNSSGFEVRLLLATQPLVRHAKRGSQLPSLQS